MKFSTNDSDNDEDAGNCAGDHYGWWHKSCTASALNGFPTKLGVWSSVDDVADVQASRMWVSIGRSESPSNISLFLCSFVLSSLRVCSTTRRVMSEVG